MRTDNFSLLTHQKFHFLRYWYNRCLCFIILILSFNSNLAAKSVVLTPLGDTTLVEQSANLNNGNLPSLELTAAPEESRAILLFDLTTLPVGTTDISSAVLQITVQHTSNSRKSKGHGSTISLHRMLSGWEENSATWNCDRVACNQWDGGYFNSDESARVKIAKKTIETLQLNVTSDVIEMISDPYQNYGWLLKQKRGGQLGAITFYSKESKFAPKLILTFDNNVDLPPVVSITSPLLPIMVNNETPQFKMTY